MIICSFKGECIWHIYISTRISKLCLIHVFYRIRTCFILQALQIVVSCNFTLTSSIQKKTVYVKLITKYAQTVLVLSHTLRVDWILFERRNIYLSLNLFELKGEYCKVRLTSYILRNGLFLFCLQISNLSIQTRYFQFICNLWKKILSD